MKGLLISPLVEPHLGIEVEGDGGFRIFTEQAGGDLIGLGHAPGLQMLLDLLKLKVALGCEAKGIKG
jgi:hypothetical protein